MEEISFEELRKIHLQEKHSSVLSALPENFYDVYLNYLTTFYSSLKDGFSIESAKTFENCRNVFLELVRLRCQKIILKSFKDSRTGSVISDGLTTQEKDLYVSMLKTFTSYEHSLVPFRQAVGQNLSFNQNLNPNSGTIVAPPAMPKPSVKLVILGDVPQFVSSTGENVGPFTAGQEVELEEETAVLLTARNLAKI